MSDSSEIRVSYAPNSEAALLGCYLLDNETLELNPPRAGIFFDRRHEVIWSRMERLKAQGGRVDTHILVDSLSQSGELSEAGGAHYVLSLTLLPATAGLAEHYLASCMRSHARRRIEELSLVLSRDASDENMPPSLAIKRARAAIEQLEAPERVAGAHEAVKAAGEVVKALLDGESLKTQTGLRALDEATNGGLLRSTCTVLAGRPGAGKTTTALQILVNMAMGGQPVIWFGLEMDLEQTSLKVLENISGAPIFTSTREALDENRLAIRRGAKIMADLPIYFDVTSTLVEDISMTARQVSRRCKLQHGEPPVVMIDYIQLVQRADATGEDHRDIGHCMGELLRLSKDLKTPIIVLSQLNRASSGRKDPTPTMADLKASGDIEQAAALIAILHSKDGETVQCEIPKARFGQTGSVELTADFSISRIW